MREILFRGKRIDNGEWVMSGNLIHFNPEGEELYYYIPMVNSKCVFTQDESDNILSIDEGTFYKVIPETVGQYTGLNDKNGTWIFEGDILSTENGTFSNTGMGHILFYKGMWTSFYGQDAIGRDCFDELHAVCNSREVIGNIHDNPELLGERKGNG